MDTSIDDSSDERPIRRRNSLPSLPDASSQILPINITDLAIKTLQTPQVLATLIPVIVSALQPIIQKTMENTLDKKLEPMMLAMNNIAQSINSLKNEINHNREKIGHLEDKVCNLQQKNAELEDKLANASKPSEIYESQIDELEQYSRRNNLRFHNLTPNTGESTSEAVIRLSNTQLNLNLSTTDIDRSHYANNKKTQIICKFTNYSAKMSIYKARIQLKNQPQKIFISEDLTKRRMEIISKLQTFRKSKQIYSFWTYDGRISFKRSENGTPEHIKTVSDLQSRFE